MFKNSDNNKKQKQKKISPLKLITLSDALVLLFDL